MLYLFIENLLFFLLVTFFTVIVGWFWRNAKPISLPEPLPRWYKIWFGTIQVFGIVVPLVVMLLWGIAWGYDSVLTILLCYFVMLGLQIITEIVTLKKFQSLTWVMVPYLYVPYRIWQLYEGSILVASQPELMWVRNLLLLEIVIWTTSYIVNLSQLPRLFRWPVQETSQEVTRHD
ncbi:hypothetical protein IQ278_16515 [Tolypothrix sp. LEGE 11397]|nr:hypothetical protein [Tolypothrix sp. PCC 7601]MBE9083708.1 hypothetical protein [Tolypothrix sp. LEGE 11397]UYD23722.1 hypothetical protein HGR01_19605 [Tolypothrix sp. PCC 7712]UYD34054.1 hypothetical protein HG267_35160 [Tolypothrix sp. PCC 7601]BAY89434.1 hypothetical protein NIES3275_14370 [Microchaete diplosiphon NIES-3275]